VLVVLGVAMICTAVWLVRATRTDVPALGPLEVMGDRRFRRRDADARETVLDAARPAGAPVPAPILEPDDVVAELPPAPAADEPEPVASVLEAAPEPSPDPEPADEAVEEPQPAESA
jgi:hypothetical protein